jgi:hypothetical protein
MSNIEIDAESPGRERLEADLRRIVEELGTPPGLRVSSEKSVLHKGAPIVINNIGEVKITINNLIGNEKASIMNTGRSANDVLFFVSAFVMVFGVVVAMSGVGLVALGGMGATEFVLFGSELNSQNTGVACVVAGVIAVTATLRRVIKGVERTNR